MTSAPVGAGVLGTTALGGDLAWNRFKTFRNVRGLGTYIIYLYMHITLYCREITRSDNNTAGTEVRI